MGISARKTLIAPFSVKDFYHCIREPIKDAFQDRLFTITGDVESVNPYAEHLYVTLATYMEPGVRPLTVFIPSYVLSSSSIPIETETQLTVMGTITVGTSGLQLRAENIQISGLGKKSQQLAEWRKTYSPLIKRPKKTLPLLCVRPAVISNSQAQGYGDFNKRFKHGNPALWSVKMQGPSTAQAIADTIRAINQAGGHDCICIVRGGGSYTDLFEFNRPELLEAIAESTLPVLTAIGHESDELLCDLVADLSFSTPTDLAFTLTYKTESLLHQVQALQAEIQNTFQRSFAENKRKQREWNQRFAGVIAIGTLIAVIAYQWMQR